MPCWYHFNAWMWFCMIRGCEFADPNGIFGTKNAKATLGPINKILNANACMSRQMKKQSRSELISLEAFSRYAIS